MRLVRWVLPVALAASMLGAACATSSESLAARALSRPGHHPVPAPPLGTTASRLVYAATDGSVFAWGARHQVDTDPLDYRPVDRGAMLDDASLRWTLIPRPPFAHPTALPEITAVAGRLVVVGNRCTGHVDLSGPTFGMQGPLCVTGRLQAASFDLRTGMWTTISVGRAGAPYIASLWPVGRRVLAVIGGGVNLPDDYALIDPISGRWTTMAPLPFPTSTTVVCSSRGTIFVAGIGGTIGAGSGPLEAVALRPGATTWSKPSPPLAARGATQVVAGCTGGRVLAVASTMVNPSWGVGPDDRSTISTWRPGSAWAPAPPIELGLIANQEPVPSSLVLASGEQLAHDRLGIPIAGEVFDLAAFDPATRTWSQADDSSDFQDLGVSIGRAELEAHGPQLVAVTP